MGMYWASETITVYIYLLLLENISHCFPCTLCGSAISLLITVYCLRTLLAENFWLFFDAAQTLWCLKIPVMLIHYTSNHYNTHYHATTMSVSLLCRRSTISVISGQLESCSGLLHGQLMCVFVCWAGVGGGFRGQIGHSHRCAAVNRVCVYTTWSFSIWHV